MSISDYMGMEVVEDGAGYGFIDRVVPGIVSLLDRIIAANPGLSPAHAAAISIGMCEDAMLYMDETEESERCVEELLDQQRAWFGGWLRN